MMKKYTKKLRSYKKKVTENPTYLELKYGTKKTLREIKGSQISKSKKKRKLNKLDKKLNRIGNVLRQRI